MIEIIKSGKKTFQLTCSKCGCIFSYSLDDLRISNYIQCPECKEDCKHPDQNCGNTKMSLYEIYHRDHPEFTNSCIICGDPVSEGKKLCPKCEGENYEL